MVVSRRTLQAPRIKARVRPRAKQDRHFVTALARGLEVLTCFRSGDALLGNGELAERCQLPKSTVSRLAQTLARLGSPSREEWAMTVPRVFATQRGATRTTHMISLTRRSHSSSFGASCNCRT